MERLPALPPSRLLLHGGAGAAVSVPVACGCRCVSVVVGVAAASRTQSQIFEEGAVRLFSSWHNNIVVRLDSDD